jgi:hypothetical protein
MNGQVIQKGFHLSRTHVTGMAFVVEENELADPEPVSLLCPGTEMTAPAHNRQLVEQTGPIGGVVTLCECHSFD